MAEQFIIARAEKRALKARIAVDGPTGSGKTYTSLRLARGLVGPGGRIGLIDTENRSSNLYADLFEFDTIELDAPYDPRRYMAAIDAFFEAGHDCIVVDSLSHAWSGKGGLLELVDEMKSKKQHGGNKFGAWREATPIQDALVQKILTSPVHIIVTMRSKMAYVLEEDDRGRSRPTKVGMQPIQRDDLEYEFTIIMDMNLKNQAEITKTRMDSIAGRVIDKPDEKLGEEIAAWLGSGVAAPVAPQTRSDEGGAALAQLRGWAKEGTVAIDDVFQAVALASEELDEPMPRDAAEIGQVSDAVIVKAYEIVASTPEVVDHEAASEAGF